MFYLNNFFKSLGESLIRGFAFFSLSCLLAFSLTHRAWITAMVEKVSPEKIVNPYFVAVLDSSVDSAKLKNFVNKLPGVLDIDDKETAKSVSKLNKLVSQLGPDFKLSSELMNFKSLRIIMNPSLSPESLQFVRSQVVKLGGSEHVTATDVKYPEVTSVMKKHPFYEFLSRAGDWGIIGLITLCWVISYWLTYNVFRSRSYIIEKFQRKKLVAAKTIASGLSSVFILFATLGVWNGTLQSIDLVLLLMVFSVFWTFSMQEWRWKPSV
jgi:predicted small integral membrane protein